MRFKWALIVVICGGLAAGWVWRSDMVNIVTWAMAAFNHSAGTTSGRAAARKAPVPMVSTATAKTGDLPIEKHAVGKVQAADSTDLTSREQGIITNIAVPDGADVKAGELLVKLDDRALLATREKDQATLDRDQATLVEAEADQKRNQALAAKGAASTQTLDQAIAAAKVAAANVAADKATVKADDVALANTEIRAPYAGRLGAFAYSVGALVSPGSMVVRLTRMAPVKVSFSLPQETLAMMRAAMANGTAAVDIRADGAPKPIRAKIDFVDNAIDSASGTYSARATVANSAMTLWPGEAVDVTAIIGNRSNVVLVPTVAVQPAAEGSIVFVVTPKHKIEVRPVKIAGAVGDTTAIASGLKAGDHVVVEGQLQLTNGMSVREEAEGHGKKAAASQQTAQNGPNP
jgi:multidrug efflux system membrane fusion protein